jgi:hypothetical protein
VHKSKVSRKLAFFKLYRNLEISTLPFHFCKNLDFSCGVSEYQLYIRSCSSLQVSFFYRLCATAWFILYFINSSLSSPPLLFFLFLIIYFPSEYENCIHFWRFPFFLIRRQDFLTPRTGLPSPAGRCFDMRLVQFGGCRSVGADLHQNSLTVPVSSP